MNKIVSIGKKLQSVSRTFLVKQNIGFLFLLLGAVLIDHGTKFLSEKYFLVHSSASEILTYFANSQQVFTIGNNSNWLDFSFTYVRNTGAAWGVMGNLPENIRPYFFYVLTIIAMFVIFVFFFKTGMNQVLTRLAIALIFSGAMGNFIDRLNLHYVIDWLHVKWTIFGWYYDYPVFNVADCCVVGGVILLFVESFKDELRLRKTKKVGTLA